MAPVAIALAFDHARRALGARRAAGELLALTAYGFALEAVAMAVFASHEYDPSWRAAPLGVPLAVAAVWAAVITSAMAVASGRDHASPGRRAVGAALVAITLDLMIEPVATRAGLWRWTPPGPWLGVPIGNFVGWSVIVGAYAYGAARWAGTGRLSIQAARRIALGAACIIALVLVGLVWTSLGLERAFADGRGWIAWAAVLVTAVLSSSYRHARTGAAPSAALPIRCPLPLARSSLPALLAATPGHRPEAVLGIVALAFAIQAVWIADAGVSVAVAGSLATLGLVAAGRRR